MLQVRNGLFETNSSSTHALIIMKTSDYNKWKRSNHEDVEDMLFVQQKDGSNVSFIKGRDIIEKMAEAKDSYWYEEYKRYKEEGEDDWVEEIVSDYASYYFGAFSPSCGDIETASVDDYTAVSFYIPEK